MAITDALVILGIFGGIGYIIFMNISKNNPSAAWKIREMFTGGLYKPPIPTITKPFESIFDDYSNLINNQNIIFIDCISHAAGISKEKSNCIYIESPSQLESILLEIMNSYKNTDDKKNKYLIIDSLSSLVIYNDAPLVTEFFTHLINRTRLSDITTISLTIEEEMNDNIRKILYLKSDKIIKLKESFI